MVLGDDTGNALYNTVHRIQNEQCREGEGGEKKEQQGWSEGVKGCRRNEIHTQDTTQNESKNTKNGKEKKSS